MYLPTELVQHVILFYVLSSQSSPTPRASISSLTLSSSILRSLALQIYYTTLSTPLVLSTPSDWTRLLSSHHHVPLANRIHSLKLTNIESFLPLLHTLPPLRVLSLPLITESPSSISLFERLTWIPASIRELRIQVRRKACGMGAVWDLIGGRMWMLERLCVKFVEEKRGGGKEEVVREIVVSCLNFEL
jgi:hypothetical protein